MKPHVLIGRSHLRNNSIHTNHNMIKDLYTYTYRYSGNGISFFKNGIMVEFDYKRKKDKIDDNIIKMLLGL